ncbi:hypothetical protein [Mycolicibacterium sp. PDY-3]|uniref:hypothetical protein n=1 Tax=Mycolicibacterium sp. PDY-3 TaxID=3376069 RepID=UPI003788BAA0
MSKELTLDEILDEFEKFYVSISEHGIEKPDAKQAILQWIADEVVGNNIHTSYCHHKPEVYNNPKCTCPYLDENNLKDDQHQILKNHGWQEKQA